MADDGKIPDLMERCVLGTAGLGGVWGPVEPSESVKAILDALEAGICAVDTAPAYGDAEQYVGEALRQWKGPRPRISTKVGRTKGFGVSEGYYDYSKGGMQRSIEQSLQTLGLDKLDILFLHDPQNMEEGVVATVVESMQTFKEKGYAFQIGLGGNAPAFFDPFIRAGVFDVLMEFNKLNACNLSALDGYLPYCNQHQIRYYAASPLHMGLLGSCYDAFTSDTPAWLSEETVETAIRVRTVADAYELELPELAHRFLLSLPHQFEIVVGASNRAQLADTIEHFKSGPLDESLVKEITACAHRKIIYEQN